MTELLNPPVVDPARAVPAPVERRHRDRVRRRWWSHATPSPVGDRSPVPRVERGGPAVGLDAVLAAGDVRCVFQPIVDLATGAVVAYEALARGPVGPWESPDVLFAAARAADRVADLDELCRTVAVRSAIERGICAPVALFVNVEPSVLGPGSLDALVDLAASAPRSLQIVLEITERELAARPAELLAAVARLRAAGWRIALDDVGADAMSMTFLSLINPDIVKIDMAVVQGRPDAASAALMNALNSYAERTGAVLLAEGVETEAHLATALALGARLGQGWMFGRPAAVPDGGRPTGALVLPSPVGTEVPRSPFDAVPAGVDLRVSSKKLLIEVSKHLERQAAETGSSAVVLSSFQQDRYFTGSTRERYRRLADRVGFVAAFGAGLPPCPVAGVRGGDLTPDDPLAQEWDIVVLAPHFAAALLARDLSSDVPTTERDRQFEFVLTYDRQVVTTAARSMMARIDTVG